MAKPENQGLMPVSEVDNAAMVVVEPEQETRSPFILGNTKEIGLTELGDMLTPVFRGTTLKPYPIPRLSAR